MKLKIFWVPLLELQDYLDKYEEKVKFILRTDGLYSSSINQGAYLLIIDVS
jgi:hypothetical protein